MQMIKIPTNVADQIVAALRFYANGDNKENVTFERGAREKQLSRLQSDPSYSQCGEDSRGHELFEEDGTRAAKALSALEDIIYADE